MFCTLIKYEFSTTLSARRVLTKIIKILHNYSTLVFLRGTPTSWQLSCNSQLQLFLQQRYLQEEHFV